MKVIIFLVCVALSLSSTRSDELYNIELAESYFEEFIKTYNKQYADEAEKQERFDIFKQNLEEINQKNQESDSAVFGITIFSDLTTEEFLNTYTGLRSVGFEDTDCENQTVPSTGSAPDSFDWRDNKKVSRVKNQLNCGSCYAFSATGNLESQYAIKYNEVVELSEQQLVDCDKGSDGCSGTSHLENPFLHWIENGAISEQDYSYTGRVGSCSYDASKVKVKVAGCVSYNLDNEDGLKETLHQVGPLTIGVDATSFQMYEQGILLNCESGQGNHAVLLVGYGTENGVPFWAIKNSWGEKWGESGYIKVKRGVNACNIMGVSPVSARID